MGKCIWVVSVYSKRKFKKVFCINLDAILLFWRGVLDLKFESHAADVTDKGHRPKCPIHKLFIFNNGREFVERDASESCDYVMVSNKAHGYSFNKKVKLHLFDFAALHVRLHYWPHHVMRWIYHYKSRQIVSELFINPKHVCSIKRLTLPAEFELPISFFKFKSHMGVF